MRRLRGFTLIELLVSMAILTVIAAIGYAALDQLLRQREQHEQVAVRLSAVQRAVTILDRDLAAMERRPVREASRGSVEAALVLGAGDGYLARWTRNGVPNPLLEPRSSLRRVAYQIEDGALVRYTWTAPDAGPAHPPRRQVLLDGVEGWTLRVMDGNGAWHETWPRVAATDLRQIPRATELTLVLRDFGSITRLIELPVNPL